MWRWFCLRAAGFPFELLDELADPQLAVLADQLNVAPDTAGQDGYLDRVRTAGRAVSVALHRAAADPRVREAVSWQNPAALTSGFDTLLRRDPRVVARTGRHRRTEALVTSYLHRYCAKNDTIGFFGPLRWGRIDLRQTAPIVRTDDGTRGARALYLEGWAVAALGRALAEPLRPWLVPRLLPQFDVAGGMLHPPPGEPVPLDAAEAAVLDALRPGRSARDVVAVAKPTGDRRPLWAALDRLHRDGRIEWTLEVPADDLDGLAALRALVRQVDAVPVRNDALGRIDELSAAVGAVAAARGDAEAVRRAGTELADTFTKLTGSGATRRPGELYAGRTLVFEECRQPDSVALGPAALEPLRAPLALVLDSARWFTAAGAALYRRALGEIFTELTGRPGRQSDEQPGPELPFIEFWLASRDLLITAPQRVVDPLTRVLQQRWGKLLAAEPAVRRVRRTAAELAPGVASAFAATGPGWPAAVHHSPDLMIAAPDVDAVAAGRADWVLGEIHPGYHTMRYASWVDCHPAPQELATAFAADLPDGVIRVGATGEQGGSATRFSPRLRSAGQRRFVLAVDTCDADPRWDVLLGRCVVVRRGDDLRVRRRCDGAEFDLTEVVADLIAGSLMPHFRLLAPAAHQPRVSIDRLVVNRESWTVPAREPTVVGFADEPDEARRFLALRRWATRLGLPRHVFVRASGEAKPVHVDLTSLASAEVLARLARRAGGAGNGAEPRLVVSEMLPAPDQLWLVDARGRRYSCEFRLVATSTSPAGGTAATADHGR
ncbi:lantibiotic dehydratase [Solwaraspora sp. WMMB335]|uniref:lantibiotic dehydratase n=1 Tax=Solwaraspora sp. WMMB335 TaxID=3404118 RepID=UPI003B95FACA